ncbi:MAG: hypothetical protein WBE72_01850, partial [Terracidiphilus sp.]
SGDSRNRFLGIRKPRPAVRTNDIRRLKSLSREKSWTRIAGLPGGMENVVFHVRMQTPPGAGRGESRPAPRVAARAVRNYDGWNAAPERRRSKEL